MTPRTAAGPHERPGLAVRDLSVVFISYDEPRCEQHWQDLRRKCPWAKRVHGVTGFDAAHKAAARLAETDHFLTIDGDTRVEPWLFDAIVPNLGNNILFAWRSRNAINGLIYGSSAKCWPRALARGMRTHEQSETPGTAVDFGFGPAGKRLYAEEVPATTYPNATPFHAFRAGLREGVRNCLIDDAPVSDFPAGLSAVQVPYLKIWCCLGVEAENGLWSIFGARLGCWLTIGEQWDFRQINDYGQLQRYWDDEIAPRFRGDGERCPLTGYAWSRSRLTTAVADLGVCLRDQLGLDVVDLTAPKSAYLRRSMAPRPAMPAKRCDMLGNVLRRGIGTARDSAKATELFQLGAALGSGNAMNNLARMVLNNGERCTADIGEACRLLLNASADGNRFAPQTLATLLRDGRILQADLALAEHYTALAAERGFTPDGPAPDADSECQDPPGTRPRLGDLIVLLRDLPIVFLATGAPGAEARWAALSAVCPGAVRLTMTGKSTELPATATGNKTDHVLIVRDDLTVAPRIFDMALDVTALAHDQAVFWPARDAITGLLDEVAGVQCWPRARLATHLTSAHTWVPTANDRREADCLAVHETNDTPESAFHSGFAAARRLGHRIRATAETSRRQHLATELGLWCSLGADQTHGPWSLFGARLACTLPRTGDDSMLARRHWRRTDERQDPATLTATTAQLGDAVRRIRGLDVVDLDAAESALIKGTCLAPLRADPFEHLADAYHEKPAPTQHDDVAAAALYRIAAAFGSSQALARLAQCYLAGRGVPEDRGRAVYLLKVARAAGNRDAAHALTRLGATNAPHRSAQRLHPL